MSFLDEIGGFTPTPDILVKQYDYSTAYVWGVVWRYCQMEDGKCKAAHDTIAERAGMSRRSLIEKLDRLIEDGYIEDLTPALVNKPHTYCTKKGEDKIKSTMQNLHSKPVESANFAQQKPSTMQELHSHYANFAQPTMQILHKKRDIEETSSRDLNKEPLPKFEPLTVALAQICKFNLRTISRATAKELADTQEIFVKESVTPDQILDFEKWRKRFHWTKNGAPTLKQVRELWGQYEAWVSDGRPEPEQPKQNGTGAKTNGTYKPTNTTTASKIRKIVDIKTSREYWVDGYGNEVPAPA